MKNMLLPVLGLAAAGTASLLATSLAHGAIVSASFNVTSAQLTTWRSDTFDGPCVTNPPGSFFSCVSPTAGAVAITPTAGGGGSMDIFQHDAPGLENDATDFASFANIVDTCVGEICPLFQVLSIDALRYEIQGIVSGGAYHGTLWAENKGSYLVNFTSVVPVPPTVWLLGTALTALGGRRWLQGKAAA